jgi:hypothetical protein
MSGCILADTLGSRMLQSELRVQLLPEGLFARKT